MAKIVIEIILGIDVSKDYLIIHDRHRGETYRLNNEPKVIRRWLRDLAAPVRIGIEPTSSYHLELVDQAHACGHTVYLVNPRQLVHYRESVDLRHKSDPDDARLIARFVAKEADELRSYSPRGREAQRLWGLIKRRAKVVECRKQLQQSLVPTKLACGALFTEFNAIIRRLDRQINALIRALGWSDHYQRCRSIPGIGPLNAAALVCAFHRGAFSTADAFIAFLGLDIKRRESGRFKGKQKLTKRGESELRRLLFCAAQPARSHPPFDLYYQNQINKGLPKIAAKVALARKLARIAFSLMINQQSFQINHNNS